MHMLMIIDVLYIFCLAMGEVGIYKLYAHIKSFDYFRLNFTLSLNILVNIYYGHFKS